MSVDENWLESLDDPESREVRFSLPAKLHDFDYPVSEQLFEITITRGWVERLFSWPWRPHHDELVYLFQGALLESDSPDDFRITVKGEVKKFTRRSHPSR